MKKLNLKCSKGITLITLVTTVVVLILLTSMIIYNVPDHVESKKLKDLQNDIQIIKEKVMSFYAKNGVVPGNVEYEWSLYAGDTFYIVDLQSLDALTLNYGQEGYNAYKNIRTSALNGTITDTQKQLLNGITDIFIFNVQTLDVYYVEGISFDGVTYYTYSE